MISIVVPAHNEEGNIKQLVNSLEKLIKIHNLNAEIVLVNDNSVDLTAKMCNVYSKKFKNIRVLNRTNNRGMGNALKDGTRNSRGNIVVWTMADLSDDLNSIPLFIEKINQGADMVLGSRYMKEGSSGDLSFIKKTSSKGFTILARLFLGLKIHDCTNAYRAFRKTVFDSIKLDSGDFGISPEFSLKTHLYGYILSEVPTKYKERIIGIPKFKIFKMAKRYLIIFLKAFVRIY